MKQIEITIGTDGQITIEGQGFVGPDCEMATAFLEQALGRITERKRKPEYHEKVTKTQTQGR